MLTYLFDPAMQVISAGKDICFKANLICGLFRITGWSIASRAHRPQQCREELPGRQDLQQLLPGRQDLQRIPDKLNN